ncbi:LOW QUALITY PROTEIN: arylacetamide deacetylase-like 4 [Megalops cyprinoides]|uniref:LOW QUALITY PROTEIN: arylacetamide deacetylase-like 4 n=1 Tax=Megalops cyprinoides TaxID=118141 RepID=UPI0018648DED|nr:LOW QUALITY PROTEIN: arylacetamide deacetylase-like 4 [Megalops cyprinoides]
MAIGLAILIIGFAAVFAAFLLLIIGLIYAELMNSEIPSGVTNRSKLHVVHILFVGIAIVGRILDRLGLCHQVSFTRWVSARFLVCKRPAPPGLHIRDMLFEGVPVRVYQPTAPSAGGRRGLVYFHGGGWVMGSIDTADEICRCIAKESKTTVVSVGYRLAPEHTYPAPLDDCEAATCHFLSVAEADFGVDPCRVAVGGDSAGGNLAAALCQRLAKRADGRVPPPRAQVLLYPALQMADFSLPSYQQNHAVPVLFRGRAAFYFLQYLCGDAALCPDLLEGAHVPPDLRLQYRKWLSPELLPPEFLARGCGEGPAPAQHDGEVYHAVRAGLDPEVSPLLGEDEVVRRTPPAFVLTCEYDVLRDDGILFRKRLEDLGVAVSWHHARDGFHGILNFYNRGWLSFMAARPILDSIVRYMETL